MKNLYKYFLIVVIVLISINCFSQEYIQISGDKLNEIMKKVEGVSSSINTLECDFKEVKSIAVLEEEQISSGKMYYQKADKIRWEYLSPKSYMFIINKGQTVVKNGDKIDRGSGGAAMVFKRIGKLILGSISGEKIVDDKRFNVSYFSNGKNLKIIMSPKDKRMMQMMGDLVFIFSLKDYYILSIQMKNPSGDLTSITFEKKVINQPIGDNIFKL